MRCMRVAQAGSSGVAGTGTQGALLPVRTHGDAAEVHVCAKQVMANELFVVVW